MSLTLMVVEPSPRFAVDPENDCRVVIMEGDQVVTGLGMANSAHLAEALTQFLSHALDLGVEPVTRFSGAPGD